MLCWPSCSWLRGMHLRNINKRMFFSTTGHQQPQLLLIIFPTIIQLFHAPLSLPFSRHAFIKIPSKLQKLQTKWCATALHTLYNIFRRRHVSNPAGHVVWLCVRLYVTHHACVSCHTPPQSPILSLCYSLCLAIYVAVHNVHAPFPVLCIPHVTPSIFLCHCILP